MAQRTKITRFRQGCLVWAGRIVLVTAGLLLITSIAGALIRTDLRAKTPPPGEMVDVGGYKMHLSCQGEGGPTVILEAGQGNMGLIWSPVQSRASQFTRVCAYDRAGLGWSELGKKPRSVQVVADELHTLLKEGGVEAPYILVGHSVGGLFVRQYTHTYPSEVVGMVLVDSVHEDRFVRSPQKEIEFLEQMVKVMPLMYGVQRAAAYSGIPALIPTKGVEHPNVNLQSTEVYQAVMKSRISYINGISKEIGALADYYDQVRMSKITSLGDIPLVVISHGLTAPSMGFSEEEAKQSEQTWQRFQQELAAQSSKGELIIAKLSGHDIHLDEPELVVEAIQKVIGAAMDGE